MAQEEKQFLPVAEGNTLRMTDSKRTVSKGRDNDDDHYEEVAPDGSVVATYYVWHHLSVYPPFPVSAGWGKYDLSGAKIAEGKTA